jgi:thiamine-phosphate pyrophosphorylase
MRLKTVGSGELLREVEAVVALRAGLVIVNDRADIAKMALADGVHLGDEDLPTAEARALLGPGLLIGRTCRTLESARRAVAEGADYVGFGPIFATRTKVVPAEPRGLVLLAAVARALDAPVVAIAGIGLENIAAVAQAGACAAAVASDLFLHDDVGGRARMLAQAFASGREGRS